MARELSRYPRITWPILFAEYSKRKAIDAWMHAAKRVKQVSLCAQPKPAAYFHRAKVLAVLVPAGVAPVSSAAAPDQRCRLSHVALAVPLVQPWGSSYALPRDVHSFAAFALYAMLQDACRGPGILEGICGDMG